MGENSDLFDIRERMIKILEGGPGSGHWGHKGRKGKRGGSVSGITRGRTKTFDKTTTAERMRIANYADVKSNMRRELKRIARGEASYTGLVGKFKAEMAHTIGNNMREELSLYTNYLAGDTVNLMHKYINTTEGVLQKYASEFGKSAGKDLDAMGIDFVRKLVYQEVESNRQQFTDHGVRHIVKNLLNQSTMLDQVEKSGIRVTGRERLMANFIMVNHDVGYTMPMIRRGGLSGIKASSEHPAFSKKIALQQTRLWDVGKIFTAKEYDKIASIIATHDSSLMDVKNDVVGTTTRISDNLALFHKEKLPSMFKYVPGTKKNLVAMGKAAKLGNTRSFEINRKWLNKKIDNSEGLNKALKRDLKNAVREINFMTPKFTLGVLAGEINTISSSANSLLSVIVKYNRFDRMLQNYFDMGQKQTKKFLNDYGITDTNKSLYRLGKYKGKAILELKIVGAPTKM